VADALDAPNTSRELWAEETRVGGLVCNATDRGEAEVNGRGSIGALFEVYAVPQHHDSIEREPWLRAVPADELVDRVGVRPLTADRRETVQAGRLGVFEVGKGQSALRCLLLT
jgi:hypothetical protein